MAKSVVLFLILLISFGSNTNAQQDSIEIFLIDSFVTPEAPHSFVLSFFTSTEAKSKIVIENEHEFPVSKKFQKTHKANIDISNLRFETREFSFVIAVEDSLGNVSSEKFEVSLPNRIEIKDESNFLLLILFAGTVFLLPNPAVVFRENNSYFSLTKEIPLISIRKQGFTYPMSYFSVEYSYVFNAPKRSFFRFGYKHIIEIPFLQYISPGINGTTNFNGFNAVSPEISLGMFRILNTFIVYSRYRYNLKPGDPSDNFSEISIGLYSNFFSIYL